MSNAQAKVQAKSPFNNGWTKEYYEDLVNNPSETKKRALITGITGMDGSHLQLSCTIFRKREL